MADEWSEGINWFQYMNTCSDKSFFFTKTSYDQYSTAKSFDEALDDKLAEIETYNVKSKDSATSGTTCKADPVLSEPVVNTKSDAVVPKQKAVPDARQTTANMKYEQPEFNPARRNIDQYAWLNVEKNVISETPYKYSFLAPLKNPRISYPRESSLTHEQHKKYLELFTRFMAYVPTNPSPAEMQDILLFKDLQMSVGVEQEEFMKYLEKAADKCREDYVQLHPEARAFAQDLLNTRLKRSGRYPRYYHFKDSVPFTLKKPFDASKAPVLSCKATLLELGPTPKVVLPIVSLDIKPKAFVEYDKLSKRYPPKALSSEKKKSWSKQDCSSDLNAEKLAIQYGADVVISAGAATCIMNNHGPAYEREWEIPIVIKEYTVDEKGQKVPRKVVFIDKPFVPKTVCSRYLNTLYHKYALKTTLIHPQNKPVAKFRTKGKDTEKTEDAERDEEVEKFRQSKKFAKPQSMFDGYEAQDRFSMDDLETFGTEKMAGSLKRRGIPTKKCDVDLTVKHLQKELFGGTSESESEKERGGKGLFGGSSESESDKERGGKGEIGVSKVEDSDTRQTDEGEMEVSESGRTKSRETIQKGGVTKVCADFDSSKNSATIDLLASPDHKEIESQLSQDSTNIITPQSGNSKYNDSPRSPGSNDVKSPMSPVPNVAESPISPTPNDVESPMSPAVNDLESPMSPVPNVAESPMSPVSIDVESPMSPVRNDVESPMSPVRNDVESPKSPVANDVESPMSPVANEVESPMSPVGNDVESPMSPVANIVESPMSPVANDVESPISPVSNDVETPMSPVSNDVDSPMSPVGNNEESPLSPVSNDTALLPNVSGTEIDRSSPLSPTFEAPASPVAEGTQRLLLSAPKIIPMERLDGETDHVTWGTEGSVFGSEAQEGDDVEQNELDPSLSEQKENQSQGRKSGPVRRSLRGRNVTEQDADSGAAEDADAADVTPRGSRRATRSTRAHDQMVKSNTNTVENAKKVKHNQIRVVDTDSDDDLGLVIDVGLEGDDSPPRPQTRRNVCRTSRSTPKIVDNPESFPANKSSGSSELPEDSVTTPRTTRSTPASDTKSSTPGSRSLRSRKPADDTVSDIVVDKTDAMLTPPLARGRATRSKQTELPLTTGAESCTQAHGKKRHSDADQAKDIPSKRLTRRSDQGLLTPEPLQPRKRGRPKKAIIDQETIEKTTDGATEERMDVEENIEKSTPENDSSSLTAQERSGSDVSEKMVQETDNVAMVTDKNPAQDEKKTEAVGCEVESKVLLAPDKDIDSKEDKGEARVKKLMKAESKPSGSTLDSILNLQQQMLRPGEKIKEDQQKKSAPQQFRPCSEDNNVTYGLWSLADLNLIIRTSHHGFLRDATSQQVKPVYLFPKLEYQPMFGVEQVTVSEQAKMWTSAFLRLNCNVIRARICAFSSDILMLEDLEPSKLLPPRGMFDPGVAMQQLHTILDKVVSLPPGVHILRHSPGESHCEILQNTVNKKSGSYDLHQSYIVSGLQEDDSPVKWVPLDPNVIMTFHRRLYRIPATFRPKGGLVNFSRKFEGNFPKKSKKKKSKGKKGSV